jgi:hypothetical protein
METIIVPRLENQPGFKTRVDIDENLRQARYLTAMAPWGHRSTQARHAVHLLPSMFAYPFTETAPVGQTWQQSPQPVHSPSSTTATVLVFWPISSSLSSTIRLTASSL